MIPGALVPKYNDFAPNAWTAVYTAELSPTGYARIKGITFCNTDTVPRDISLSLAPNGGVANANYRLFDQLSIAPRQTIMFSELDLPLLTVSNTGQIGLLASAASVIATKITVEEVSS